MRTLKPMLVTAGSLPPDSHPWSYEVKWDGFRAIVEAGPTGVKVTSRNGYDMTSRYPELHDLAGAVSRPVLLDGEIVVLDDDGTPDFAAPWVRNRRSVGPRSSHSPGRLCFMAFDLLQLGDELLIDRPYSQRRTLLEELGLEGRHWCTPEIHVGEGEALFAATKEMGLEGVVAKRLDSRYRPGLRSKSWIKTKHFQKRTFALLGWLRRRSGERTGDAWSSACNPPAGWRWPASSSRATAATSLSSYPS